MAVKLLWLGVRMFVRLLLVVLAGDLLYLYYAGGWYDPTVWIEVTELVFLYAVVIGSVAWTVWTGVRGIDRCPSSC